MTTTDDVTKSFICDTGLQKRLAKHLVLTCFRNTILEDLHSGTTPDSKIGDYSDVVVLTPYGEIPWRELSRFDDKEMKALIINVTNATYHLIQELFDEKRGGELLLKLAKRDPAPNWDDPV